MSEVSEYERLSAEILQNQRVRVTLFTFSVTTTAAIIGLTVKNSGIENILISIFAIYTVLIPSIMMINHYTRSVNYISEYLHVIYGESWMKHFDKLNEDILPIQKNISQSHKAMHILGTFSTGKIFNHAYIVLNIFVLCYAGLKMNNVPVIYYGIVIGFFILMLLTMWIFRPITKKEYRQLWIETKKSLAG